MILTTPNAVRLTNLGAMLAGKNFFDLYHPRYGPIYGRHNREYTVGELQQVLGDAGYRNVRVFAEDLHDYDVIDYHSVSYEGTHKVPFRKRELLEMLRYANGDLAHRGDNLYAVGEKSI